MLHKCSVCGYIYEGDEAPDNCPKCRAPKEKFETLSAEAGQKIYDADRTNDIHMEIATLAMRIAELAEEGIEIDLDPPCVALFEDAKKEAWQMKQRSKAEIEGHASRSKW